VAVLAGGSRLDADHRASQLMVPAEEAPATLAALLKDLPEPLVIPDARQRIRAEHRAAGRRIVVLDDDPTGSQAVHSAAVVTSFTPAALAAGLGEPGALCFVLTNSRSMPEAEAARSNSHIAAALADLERSGAGPIEVASRSDSTLRGHLRAEVGALDAVRRRYTGQGYDGVLLIPAFFEAGRRTAEDIHWARVGAADMPVAATEFSQDPVFGYSSSDLRQFVAERYGGSLRPDQIHRISLTDIRAGGPDRVQELLTRVTGGAFVVVNACCYADLEIVVLGLIAARQHGRQFLCRCGPSFVRALTGIDPRPPLTPADIWPEGHPGSHGLVVVGSHVRLTDRQLTAARADGALIDIELDAAAVLDPGSAERHVHDVADLVQAALARSDVLLTSSRTLVQGTDAVDSLRIARTISAALATVVRDACEAKPAWVLAKGGITSHDVAVHGLGMRRAEVTGQLFPGMVSVFRPIDADARVSAFVVFAGNVGDERALADVVARLRGAR
jgi:uncharacterized protein YgbK (DUF1537 family)